MAGFCPSVSTLNALLNSNRSLQNKQMSEHLKGKSEEIYSASRSTSVVISGNSSSCGSRHLRPLIILLFLQLSALITAQKLFKSFIKVICYL